MAHLHHLTYTSNSQGLSQYLLLLLLNNDDHVLRYILPDRRNNTYSLRPKRHELTLATIGDSRNLFQRLLFKDMY